MGSTHVAKQLSFSMFLSIFGVGVGFENCFGVHSCSVTTFIFFVYFNSDFGSFWAFWGPNGLFSGLGQDSKTVLGSTHVVQQLSFSMVLSILTIDCELILG